MATAQTIIDRALRLILELDSGVSATAAESADALVSLNAMLDSWRNDRLMCYAYQDESLSMVANQQSYQIGPGGDLSTTRPVSIEDAYIVQNTNSYWVRIIPDAEYDALPNKTTIVSTWPEKINYRPTMPTGTLYVYPVSDGTTCALHMRTRIVLSSLALTDTVSLPPGWEEGMAFNLAIRMAPEYQTQTTPEVKQMALEALNGIKRVNAQPMKAYTELPWLTGPSSHRANILTDQP